MTATRELTRQAGAVRRLDVVDPADPGWEQLPWVALGRVDLVVAVDRYHPSMAVWGPTVGRLVALAKRCGRFGSVTVVDGWDTVDKLPDGAGYRVVLALTDGVSPAWRVGALSPLLARWGEQGTVVLGQVLAEHLWHRTGLAVRRGRLGELSAFTPNVRWRVDVDRELLDSPWRDPSAPTPVPIPVVPLGGSDLRTWAARIVEGCDATSGFFHLAGAGEIGPDQIAPHAGGPEEAVRRFRSTALPSSYRLATALAAVPLRLDTMWVVQGMLLPAPESDPRNLAEVLVSGLLEPVDGTATGIVAEFGPGVRRCLLRAVSRFDTVRAAEVVSLVERDRVPAWRHVGWALEEPDDADEPEVTDETRPFVLVELALMEALAGPYARRAHNLRVALGLPLDQSRAVGNLPGMPFDRVDRDGERGGVVESERHGQTTHIQTTHPTVPVDPNGGGQHRPRPVGEGRRNYEVDPPGEPPAGVPRSSVLAGGALPPVFGGVPPKNPNFTGRVELLEALGERLKGEGTTAVLPEALHGLGGVGKTLIVVEYVYRHTSDFEVIWWIPAAGRAQIQASLVELAQRLGLQVGTEANTAVRAVLDALGKGIPYSKWLLVFDNAEDPRTVEEFLPPTTTSGRIVVTSRNPSWDRLANPLEVALFTRDESKELLHKRGPVITDEEADRLAELLGDLPLALEQAAAWRAETGMPVAEYLRIFDEKSGELLAEDETAEGGEGPETSPPYARSVSVAWKVSLDALRERAPSALELLQLASFLAPDAISRQYFTDVQNVQIGAEHLDAALRDPVAIGRAIRALTRYSLVKIDYPANSLQIHRLVQAVVTNEMSSQEHARMRHGAHQLLARAAPNNPEPPRNWPDFQRLLPHAYASRVVESGDPWARQLVVNLMKFLYWWGAHDEAVDLAREAYDLWSEHHGETDAHTLDAANWLGWTLRAVGRYRESAEVNRRTLDLRRQLEARGDGGTEEVLNAINQVAADQRTAGDFRAALALDEEAYQTALRQFGEDDETTLLTAHNFAVDLRQTGQYRRALALDEDTYQRRVELLGPDAEHTLSTLHGLIADRREAGDYVGARAAQEEATRRALELAGGRMDAPTTLRRVLHLAVAQRKDGDHQAALDLSTDVWKRFQQRYGDDHPQTMSAALARSIDLRQTGDLNAAGELGEVTYQRYRHNLGEEHPHTAAAAADLAVARRLLGDPVAARRLNELARAQLTEGLGAEHPHLVACVINLASDLAATGQVDAALEVGGDTITLARRVLGTDHPTTLAVELNHALDLRAAGKSAESRERLGDVLARYNQTLGVEHPATAAAISGVRADCDIDPLPL